MEVTEVNKSLHSALELLQFLARSFKSSQKSVNKSPVAGTATKNTANKIFERNILNQIKDDDFNHKMEFVMNLLTSAR